MTGELDLATFPELGMRLAEAAEPRERFLLDTRDLEFMDSTGPQTAAEGRWRGGPRRVNLTITRPPDGAVLRLLELTRILDVLPVADPAQLGGARRRKR